MSRSPIDVERSQTYPSFPDLHKNPSSDHGILQEVRETPDHQIGSLSLQASHGGAAGSAQVSASESPRDEAVESSGLAVAFSEDSCDPSKNVAELRGPEAKKGSYGQNSGSYSHCQSTVQGGISSQSRSNQFGPQINGKQYGTSKILQSDHLATSSSSLQGNAAQSSSRRNQVVNANHLLNFHYDPISRPPPRVPPPRRQRKIKPYNKDLFLQANYKFVVLDTGSYLVEPMDPDKMLQWEDVVCVRYSTPFPVQCPICLERPLCPQITSCGHIFCFPCILRYLLIGEEDHKGGCWKKCPLCFMMISSRDLYTIHIDTVKQLHVGDFANFTLLTRPKDSLVPSLKNQQRECLTSCGDDGISDAFSKFTLTTDVELSVREAKSDLNNWLCEAESGLVDDLERLPYVCAALEQLEERMKNWTGHRNLSDCPPLKNSASLSSTLKAALAPNKAESNALVSTSNADGASPDAWDSYTFYQATDGQHLILHPLNMKCLLHHYGNQDMLPPRIYGEILELETVTQSEAIRRRYRSLSHFSLTTTFQLCEIDLSEILPPISLAPFMDEIKKRDKQRKRLARKEQDEKARAEAAAMHVRPIPSDCRQLSQKDAVFSSDDFEALGSTCIPSTSPPVSSERKLFSDVARLGFAAAHDSPSLKAEGSADSSLGNMETTGGASNTQGPRSMTTLSFANIASAPNNVGSPVTQNTNGLGRKGKKSTRVLLSTAGGRRY